MKTAAARQPPATLGSSVRSLTFSKARDIVYECFCEAFSCAFCMKIPRLFMQRCGRLKKLDSSMQILYSKEVSTNDRNSFVNHVIFLLGIVGK